MFVDPIGWHIIISMQSGVNFYTTRNSKKVKQLMKAKVSCFVAISYFQDLLFDSVVWNEINQNLGTTQEILIGCNSGEIIEAMFTAPDERFRTAHPESHWKEVCV